MSQPLLSHLLVLAQQTAPASGSAVTTLLQTLVDGFTVGSLYALIALGYTMVYGILKFINFAHSDIFALGVHMTIVIAGWFGVAGASSAGVPAWYVGLGVLVLSMATCGLVGFIIERLAYKPLRDAPRLNVLITAIGVSLFLENVGQLKPIGSIGIPFGPYPSPTPTLVANTTLFTLSGVDIHLIEVTVVGTALLLMLGLQFLIFRTKLGSAMRAVSFNHRTAALMGINVNRVISITFVIGSMLAAAAGFLYALKYSGQAKQTADAMWIMLGLKAFVAAVVGGIGNVRGAVIGGLLIGLIEFFGVQYLSSQYRDAYVFIILILVLLLRPEGIFGKAVAEKV
ncbi:MAG TPA: branched-chain amino acid ABC transporter permease [Phycisphaerales bacterium]|nr:branched-chain amino acid ABC transporter permease [Phycisphaerales bacterium]